MGIDLAGSIKKGVMRSSSAIDLETALLNDDIAPLSIKQKKTVSVFKPIRTTLKVNTFRQLATLIDAGIYLDHALSVIYEQTTHIIFKKVLEDCNKDVNHGLSLYAALQKYPDVFDHISLQLIQAGEHGSNLAKALSMLADYHERKEEFQKKLRSAAFLPCITLIFFLIISIVILVAIVPMFSSMFNSLGKEMPSSIKRMQAISSFFTFKNLILSTAFLFGFITFLKRLILKSGLKHAFDKIIFKIPIFGNVLLESKITYFLQSSGLLLHGGVPIVRALEIATNNVSNSFLQSIFFIIQQEINQGKNLSAIMVDYPKLFKPDVIALIRVGEESAKLNIMIDKAAQVYRARVGRKLHFLTTIFQPMLMIFLGFMIMALILSVYIPIFDLSYAVG